jgi:hypothetical protein
VVLEWLVSVEAGQSLYLTEVEEEAVVVVVVVVEELEDKMFLTGFSCSS